MGTVGGASHGKMWSWNGFVSKPEPYLSVGVLKSDGAQSGWLLWIAFPLGEDLAGNPLMRT